MTFSQLKAAIPFKPGETVIASDSQVAVILP